MPESPTDNPYAPPRANVEPIDGALADGRGDSLGWVILAVPAVGGALVPVTNALGLATVHSLLGFVVPITTIVLIAKDAPRWGMRGSRFILGLLLIWMIAFPLYFHERAKRGAPRRVLLAIASVALYLVGSFWFIFAQLQ